MKGQKTSLAVGTKGTVIIYMATWCKFCAYTDRYDVPAIDKKPGMVVDIVDVSTKNGIATPGPLNPPFTGQDGKITASNLSTSAMVADMKAYIKAFHLSSYPATVHEYVGSSIMISTMKNASYPTIATINGNQKLTKQVHPGGLTVAPFKAFAYKYYGSSQDALSLP